MLKYLYKLCLVSKIDTAAAASFQKHPDLVSLPGFNFHKYTSENALGLISIV